MPRVLLNNLASPWGGCQTPPPRSRISLREKMKFSKGNIDLGDFWYTNFWIPPPPFSKTLDVPPGGVWLWRSVCV